MLEVQSRGDDFKPPFAGRLPQPIQFPDRGIDDRVECLGRGDDAPAEVGIFLPQPFHLVETDLDFLAILAANITQCSRVQHNSFESFDIAFPDCSDDWV